MALSVEDAVLNWQQGMGSDKARQKYLKNTAQPKRNPMEAAATDNAMQAYQDGVRKSITSGKRAAALQNTPLSAYVNGCKMKGADRLQSGAAASLDKYRKAAQKWIPVMQQASDAAKALPKGGKVNAMARVSAALDVIMGAAGTA